MQRADSGDRLVETIREALLRAADPAKAPAMQAYMKSAMPFLGVQTPLRRALCKQAFTAHPLPDAEAWGSTVLRLWREARHREERYAAVDLSGQRAYRAFQTLDALPMYEEMIVTGAWWDFVDELAIHRVGPLLRSYTGPMRRRLLAWSRCDDLWKRRSAILAQIAFKEKTDLDLLFRCIEPALPSREFFLRKAIGWSLRQLSAVRPREVVRYVKEHEAELSPLSRREALRNTLRANGSDRAPRINPASAKREQQDEPGSDAKQNDGRQPQRRGWSRRGLGRRGVALRGRHAEPERRNEELRHEQGE